jgi:hypothetical protein
MALCDILWLEEGIFILRDRDAVDVELSFWDFPVAKDGMHREMNEQEARERNMAVVFGHLQTLEAARSALASDIGALRQAILKGSRMVTLDLESLAKHLSQTHRLLAAAQQACEAIVSLITGGTT